MTGYSIWLWAFPNVEIPSWTEWFKLKWSILHVDFVCWCFVNNYLVDITREQYTFVMRCSRSVSVKNCFCPVGKQDLFHGLFHQFGLYCCFLIKTQIKLCRFLSCKPLQALGTSFPHGMGCVTTQLHQKKHQGHIIMLLYTA